MKNLLKKTISILTALAVLLCAVSAFADEYAETGEASIPTFEVGRGISGTIQPDSAAEIRVRAARSSQVKFTLTLTDDCGIKVAVDGSGTSLECPNAGLPVYTFTRYFGQNESHIISLTSGCTVGYSIISEPIPEETVPEVEPEAAPEAAPEAEPEAAPEAESETFVEEAPAPADEPAGKPMQKPDEAPTDEPETDPVEEQPGSEENSEQKQLEFTMKDENPEGPAVTTEENEPAAETIETEQSEQPETTPETAETENQSAEEEQPVQQEEQAEEQVPEQLASEEQNPEQVAQPEEQAEEQEYEQPESEELNPGQSDNENSNEEAIIITKSLTPDESWSGSVRNRKATILKLDVAQAETIHMLVEGKDVCYSVQKADRLTEDAGHTLTDSQTNRSITSWSAEEGSYLISIHAGENSLLARVSITFLSDSEFKELEEDAGEDLTEETEEKITNDLSDEEMIALGYYKAQTVKRNGADVYATITEDTDPMSHLSHGQEIWVKPTQDKKWAEIYSVETTSFVKWDDLLIVPQQEEDADDSGETEEDQPKDEENKADETENAVEVDQIAEEVLPVRSIKTSTTAYGKKYIAFGTEITLEAELENFTNTDIYTIQWQYSKDGVEYFDAQNADALSYTYIYSLENYNYLWRIAVTIEDSPSEDMPAEDYPVEDNTNMDNE